MKEQGGNVCNKLSGCNPGGTLRKSTIKIKKTDNAIENKIREESIDKDDELLKEIAGAYKLRFDGKL